MAKAYLGWGLCGLALLLVTAGLASVLWGVIGRALPVWHWSVLTEPTTATGGGLSDEIAGTLEIVVGVGILPGVVGVLSGIYLAEYAKGRFGALLRGVSEILAGIPSIVLGYVAYIALGIGLHWDFSLASALIALWRSRCHISPRQPIGSALGAHVLSRGR